MKHHELAEHVASCKSCQRAAGRLALLLEIVVLAHLEARAEAHRNAQRNGRGNVARLTTTA